MSSKSYDLFLHNCNNFTNDFSMFLVGKNIPDRITSLPETVMRTSFGQMLMPQLDQALRSVTQVPVAPPSIDPNADMSSSLSTMRLNSNPHIVQVTRLHDLESELSAANSSCAVIFFTSSTCGRSNAVSPVYDELADEFEDKATLIRVDIDKAQGIVSRYSIRATPTFITYLRGKPLDQWSGADLAKLKETLRTLVRMAHPPHPHIELQLPSLQRKHKYAINAKPPPIDKLFAGLSPTIQRLRITQALKSFVEDRAASSTPASVPLPDLASISAFIRSEDPNSFQPTLWAFIELLRISLADPRVSGYFAGESASTSLMFFLVNHAASNLEAPNNILLAIISTLCNMFTSTLTPLAFLVDERMVAPLLSLICETLLDDDHTALQGCTYWLTYNVCVAIHRQRLDEGESDGICTSSPFNNPVLLCRRGNFR